MLSLALMAIDTRFQYFSGVRQVLSVVLYPLQKLANIPATLYEQLSEFSTREDLIEENTQLKQQHLVDRGQLMQLRALETENVQLRKLLGATRRVENRALMTEILHIPRDPFNRKVMLGKGSQSGVLPGQVVVDDLGVVGQITRDYLWASEATLITDKDHSVPVQVVRNGLRSIISGTGRDDVLELRYVAANTDIQEGDVLVTSGIDGVYPPGLPVAVVSKIERSPGSIFTRATCTPLAGVNRNRQLLILSRLASSAVNPAKPMEIKPETRKREEGGIR